MNYFIPAGTLILNGITYYIFLNEETWHRHYFKFEDKRLIPVIEEEKKVLDEIFDDKKPIYIESSTGLRENVIVFVGGVFIYVYMVIGSPCISALFNQKTSLQYFGFNPQIVTFVDKNVVSKFRPKEENSFESVVRNNPNITEEEKQYLIEDLKLFYEQRPNIPIENLKRTIGSVRYVYEKEFNDPFLGGYYNINTNTIHILEENKNCVRSHENFHALFTNPYTGNTGLYDMQRKIGRYLNEGFNSLCDFEKTGGSVNSYNNPKYVIKILAEIIGSEIIQKAAEETNIDLVLDELTKITGTKHDAISLVSTLDTYGFLFSKSKILEHEAYEYGISFEKKESKLSKASEAMNSANENLKKVKEQLTKYYEVKFNRSVEEDILVSSYLMLCTEDETEIKEINENDCTKKLIRVDKSYFYKPVIIELPQAMFTYEYKKTIYTVSQKEIYDATMKQNVSASTFMYKLTEILDEPNRYVSSYNNNSIK